MKRLYTLEEDNFLKENYVKMGRKWCAEKLNRTPGSVKCRSIRQLEIKSNEEEILKKQSTWRKKIHKVYENKFINLDNSLGVYLLGLLWADGYLRVKEGVGNYMRKYRIYLGQSGNDGLYLESLLSETGKWNKQIVYPKDMEINGKFYKSKVFYNFNSSNYYLGEFLYQNDYHIKSKMSADKILSKIPDHLKHYWWRGYFDGDGCFYIAKNLLQKSKCCIKITSTLDQDWNFSNALPSIIPNLSINISRTNRIYKKCSELAIHGRINCLLFGNYIFTNRLLDNLGLLRKFNKFLILVKDIKAMIENPHEHDVYWNKPREDLVKIINLW